MSAPVSLPSAEAACLQVLCAGFGRPTMIALRCVQGIGRALASLSDLRLAEKGQDEVLGLTACGRKPSRTVVPGSPAACLLALLETPRHRADLPDLLGVTRERVRQLVVCQSEAVSKRPRTLWLGSSLYDPTNVGYHSTDPVEGSFQLDTSRAGNSHKGHEFSNGPKAKGVMGGLLTPDERFAT